MSYGTCSLNAKCQEFLLWGLKHVWSLRLFFVFPLLTFLQQLLPLPKTCGDREVTLIFHKHLYWKKILKHFKDTLSTYEI